MWCDTDCGINSHDITNSTKESLQDFISDKIDNDTSGNTTQITPKGYRNTDRNDPHNHEVTVIPSSHTCDCMGSLTKIFKMEVDTADIEAMESGLI